MFYDAVNSCAFNQEKAYLNLIILKSLVFTTSTTRYK
jgi:hypothetical protein